jgi:hypothetical protein
MAEVLLHFEMSDAQDLDGMAELVERRLSGLDMVNDVEAAPEETRLTGLEIAAAIAVGISIAKSGRELVAELRKLVPEIKGLIGDVKGLKNVVVEVGDRRVPVSELTDQHIEELGKG